MTTNSDKRITTMLNFITAAVPGGIEAQEAQGQRDLVRSTTLPIAGDWDTLMRWGVIQGEKSDDLFCHCTLPEGWSKVATDHSMWSNLVDARGLIRASIFYKAAFYDRDAHINEVKRFSIAGVYEDMEDRQHGSQYKVRDYGLLRSVFIDTPVRTGELKGELIAFKDDQLYNDKGRRQKRGWRLSEVTLLSESEFYDKWHNRETTQHDFLRAIDNLALVECEKYLAQLPTDDSIWESQFDLPEVTQP